ncbi:hypothetical protein M0657_011289 [Pyricularia oryzae]|nr:hypothetical protein M0657_011289 [Pyricularia oryzae]
MEGISKKSAATSNQFRIIGTETREYTLNSYLFKEAKYGFVTWDDIDERTFLSFWDYVYIRTGGWSGSFSCIVPCRNEPFFCAFVLDTNVNVLYW